MQKTLRPIRFSIKDAEGRTRTLHAGTESLVRLDKEAQAEGHIFFGIAAFLAQAIEKKQSIERVLDIQDVSTSSLPVTPIQKNLVLWLESPQVLAAIQAKYPTWHEFLPAHWQRVNDIHSLLSIMTRRALWWHTQNMHCFPDFWASIFGFVHAWLLRGQDVLPTATSIILPGDHNQLLHRELSLAFKQQGYNVHAVQALENTPSLLHALLREEQARMLFSVNMLGLDTEGKNFALLHALQIPVGIWFVDNPWHVLSALRTSWWKQATLFVTDASFIPDLRRLGAVSVHHLPLAAAQHMWCPHNSTSSADYITKERRLYIQQQAAQAPCIFVGRAAFPHKAQFFAASRVPSALLAEALSMLPTENRPHFHWWTQHILSAQKDGTIQDVWPGHGVRSVGLGAEHCSMQQRALWLKQVVAHKGRIFGDKENWCRLLPEADAELLQPAIDYYTELPYVYAAARTVLNVTSLLLPAGLTQRHFDVWAAGGFLLTDSTAGLDIFPQDLTKALCITRPTDIITALNRHTDAQREELCHAWQKLLRTEHCYTHRVETILTTC